MDRERIEEIKAPALTETSSEAQPDIREVLREANAVLAMQDYLQESIAELELARDDAGWLRVGGDPNGFEFSREWLKGITRASRVLALKNPIIKRPVRIQTYYVWGQGIQVQARDPEANDVIQSFLDDPDNRMEFSGQMAAMGCETELQVSGNIFFVLFEDARQQGRLKVRSIPLEEIIDIVVDPNDRRRPWFYKREWTVTVYDSAGEETTHQECVYYPDWRYAYRARPTNTNASVEVPKTWKGKPIRWDAPIYHVKAGGYRDMRFGVPETYAAQDWAVAYKNFLEDFATVSRSLARFAWQTSGHKSMREVNAFASRLGTGIGSGSAAETNPVPGAGSAFASMNASLQPVRTSGATTGPDEARRLFLMAAAADGIPETFYGDASVGTLATAKSLDRPTELKFRTQQQLWAEVYQELCRLQLALAIEHGSLPGATVKLDADGDLVSIEIGGQRESTVDVSFPSILEHDKLAEVQAMVEGATLKGATLKTMPPKLFAQLMFGVLGVPDADEWVERLYPDGEGEEIEVPDPEPTDPAAMVARDAEQERVAEAVRTLRTFVEGK